MIHVCGCVVAFAQLRWSDFAVLRLSIPRQAPRAARRASGTKISPARSRWMPAPMAMTEGMTSWTTPVPRLPPAALSPNAFPFSASGKKKEMFVIDEAKFPPPKPASAATSSRTPKGVSGRPTTHASPNAGRSRRSAEITVQLRPPKTGTAKVYGTRRKAPTRLGTAMSQNCWSSVRSKPAAGSWGTTTLQTAHTQKPRNSAPTEWRRLRRAVAWPPHAQNSGSSGSQWSIQRPARRTGPAGSDVVVVDGVEPSVEVMRGPSQERVSPRDGRC